ncbi:hypothetical protein NXC14_PC00696 (plasmid) [Rhizobium sp. NXC14]|uniref:DUF2243 domain-containing protein n=1 Tax=Rhizobium sp. NXC14 TaxID=1981173 RepID=UPI000A20B3E5|nr:DUF2243 domain-containing protein [Rhizobium sp. NXC14]ARO34229.1 hypothetical protein NXC14_PC00696 [Rhizobium sp. NXC14]
MVDEAAAVRGSGGDKNLRWGGIALGFGLGGFFDGILLHQILQWHHLLSGRDQEGRDIRFLILTDGLFHALMYVIAAAGLWLLWRARSSLVAAVVGDRLIGNALLGFGGWHIIDAFLSHWILGLHRIRMDVANPLLWDVMWLSVFGVIPFLAGIALRRKPPKRNLLLTSPLALVSAVLISGTIDAMPAPGNGPVLVMFRPDVAPAEAMAAIATLKATLLWTDPSEQVWAVELPPGAHPSSFYQQGSLFVSKSIVPAGCFDRIKL